MLLIGREVLQSTGDPMRETEEKVSFKGPSGLWSELRREGNGRKSFGCLMLLVSIDT